MHTMPAGAASNARATSAIGNPARITSTTARSVQMKHREYLRCDLRQRPAHNRVACSDVVHVTGLQFLPQAAVTHAAPASGISFPVCPRGPFWHMTRGASGVSAAGAGQQDGGHAGVYSSGLDRVPTCAGQAPNPARPSQQANAPSRCATATLIRVGLPAHKGLSLQWFRACRQKKAAMRRLVTVVSNGSIPGLRRAASGLAQLASRAPARMLVSVTALPACRSVSTPERFVTPLAADRAAPATHAGTRRPRRASNM
jgi:hypothetical protein